MTDNSTLVGAAGTLVGVAVLATAAKSFTRGFKRKKKARNIYGL